MDLTNVTEGLCRPFFGGVEAGRVLGEVAFGDGAVGRRDLLFPGVLDFAPPPPLPSSVLLDFILSCVPNVGRHRNARK